ncbi:MAG: hypothetical protein P8181_10090 [bacterium]
MTTGFVKYITTLFFAVLILLLILGLAFEAQKVWKYGWATCVFLLIGILLVLVGFGDSNSVELNLQKCIARYHAHKHAGRGKDRPVFGDPDDTRYFGGDDRPLPASLAHRIAVYTQFRKRKDPNGFKSDIAAASSFNALMRRELKSGKL